MDIQIDPHTLARAEERGTNEEEIADVLRHGTDIPAKFGRKGKAKVYEFNQKRLGRYYAQKRVEVFYAAEDFRWITVTVYVFYGQWEGS
ncbi:MAG: hypothetical protein ACYCPQ_01620 [Elusimicrobiota bacterium]